MRFVVSTPALVLALVITGHVQAQLILQPIGTIERPSGSWADTVLVAFDPQAPVGTFRRVDGMGDERAIHAVFALHPATILKRLLGPGLESEPGAQAQVLKVNRLRVDEVGSKTLCLLHAEILERRGGAYFRRFETTVVIEGDRCGKRAECHNGNIWTAVQEFLNRYRKTLDISNTGGPEVPLTELSTAFQVDPINTPILTITRPRRGLYRTFMDFRTDKPDSLAEFMLRETASSPGGKEVVRVKSMAGQEVEQYWGLCDGVHSYVRVGRSFIKLHRSDRVYTAAVPQPNSADPTAIVLGGVFFGVAGGVIAGAASTGPSSSILCELNMLCGDLAPRDHSLVVKDYAMHVFHVSRFTKSEATVSVTCEGMPAVMLAKQQWTSFQLPPQASVLNVLITGPKNSLSVPINTNTDKLHVYLIDIKKDGAISLNDMNGQMSHAIMDDLKPEDKR